MVASRFESRPRRRRRTHSDNANLPPGVDPGAHQALTDLHAYVLALVAERDGLERRLRELHAPSATAPQLDAGSELVDLRRRRSEIAAQLDVVRRTIAALCAHADPGGRYL
jgi:hypothetical protein